ncbi:MAG: outer membrane lipoprotein-sorting protein [Spirochaetales bacterium]|nr:outer membrane lipoprotein-sorting protein [Spirochaetales bacterium]
MKRVLIIMSYILFLWFSLVAVAGENEAIQAQKIVKKVDELYRSTSSKALLEMEIITPHWQRTLKIQAYSKGMDKTFMRIVEPLKEKGMATLRIANEMWNYLPKTNKVIKIPPSLMMGSWMGSDFTNDDLVKEFTFFEDYNFEMTTVNQAQTGVLYVKCIPKDDVPVVWGYVLVAVDAASYLPLWERFYDEGGELVRELLFKENKRFGQRLIPSVMELIPKQKQGQKTIIRYLEAQFDIALSQDLFTLRNLRSE